MRQTIAFLMESTESAVMLPLEFLSLVIYICLTSESQSRSVVSNSLQTHGLYSAWNSPGQDTRMGSGSFLQGIIPTQGSNPGLPHSRQILYQLSHQGSPRILEWVVMAFLHMRWPKYWSFSFSIIPSKEHPGLIEWTG